MIEAQVPGWFRGAVLLIVFAALSRIVLFVSHEPMFGYANQYDMVRVSACLDFWPVKDNPTAATTSAPLPTYSRRFVEDARCQPGSEIVLAGAFLMVMELIDPQPTYDRASSGPARRSCWALPYC